MVTRKLILGATVAFSLAAACARSPSPPPATQTPARAADNMKSAGPGYYGGASENVNRPSSTPGGLGGGPASETMEHSDMDHSGVDPSNGKPTTGAPSPGQSDAETDMTGAPPEKSKSKKKTK